MSVIPEDVLRQTPASFDQWVQSYNVRDPEERMKLSQAADKLLGNPVFLRVLGQLEMRALSSIEAVSLEDRDKVIDHVMLLKAARTLRVMVKGMALEAQEHKQRQDQGST